LLPTKIGVDQVIPSAVPGLVGIFEQRPSDSDANDLLQIADDRVKRDLLAVEAPELVEPGAMDDLLRAR
jgi:hypothetical protein